MAVNRVPPGSVPPPPGANVPPPPAPTPPSFIGKYGFYVAAGFVAFVALVIFIAAL